MEVNPVLCVIQARMGSKRLPNKMLCTIHGKTLIDIAIEKAREAFGNENVVVAIPDNNSNALFRRFLKRRGVEVFAYAGEEWDVLSRFYRCALRYRRERGDVIFRWTPDDAWKQPELCRAVADGERGIPVEFGGEAITFGELAKLHFRTSDPRLREHIGHLITPNPTPAPPGVWTIDTASDLWAANQEEAA